jgi:signal transduction histidine kinase
VPWVPVAILLADTLIFAGARSPGWWATVAYGLAVAGTVALRRRSAPAAYVAAIGLALVSGAGLVLLLWAGYQAGRAVVGRSGGAVVVGAAVGGLVGQLALQPKDGPVTRTVAAAVTTYLVFAVLPLLAGRYLAQHERLVRHLRWSRDLQADRERLDERLRIARTVHDSLGHRLSLVSVQAAALEVADLPAEHRHAVRQLAGAARSALDDLYDLVGTLREPGPAAAGPGVDAVDALVAEHRAAGVAVTFASSGDRERLGAPVDEAVYRVVEEGLTNAAKHAPGQPVTVTMAWEPDSVLVRVTNPVVEVAPGGGSGGFGLAGLDERVRAAGGMLRHDRDDSGTGQGFTVLAMLPTVPADLEAALEPGRLPATRRTVTLGGVVAASVLVLVLLAMVTGVRT